MPRSRIIHRDGVLSVEHVKLERNKAYNTPFYEAYLGQEHLGHIHQLSHRSGWCAVPLRTPDQQERTQLQVQLSRDLAKNRITHDEWFEGYEQNMQMFKRWIGYHINTLDHAIDHILSVNGYRPWGD